MTKYWDPYNLAPLTSSSNNKDDWINWRFFPSYINNVYNFALTYYTGLAVPLKITGKLAKIWTEFNRALVEHGRIAIVEYGSDWLLARVIEGKRNFNREWVDLKLAFLNDEGQKEFKPFPGSYVVFYWNSEGEGFSTANFRYDLAEIWKTKQLISWDQEKSKKRLAVKFQRKPDKNDWKEIENNIESGYVAVLAPEKMTNELQDYKWLETRNTSERQQLWKDKAEMWSEMCLFLGIRHNPFAKEERQNNPEVLAGQSYFDKWENERLEKLVEGLLELQSKSWGRDVELLVKYGGLAPCLIKKSEAVNNLDAERVQQLLTQGKANDLLTIEGQQSQYDD